jgi:hypothetical protein
MYSVSPIISMVPYHLQRLKKENPDRFLVGVGVPSIENFEGGWGWGGEGGRGIQLLTFSLMIWRKSREFQEGKKKTSKPRAFSLRIHPVLRR